MKNLQQELNFKLKQIQKIFDTNTIIHIQPTITSIADYYKVNKFAYSLFANKDFIHMGISKNGKYSSRDLLEQAKFVDRYIKQLKAKKVLELATGRGATSAFLAKIHPDIIFEAIDLPGGQIDFAFSKAKKLKNFHPKKGDYHNLSDYPKQSFDVIFVIEALCYSTNKTKVFSEVRKLLKDKGVFIIFDGFRGRREHLMTKEELFAIKLTEKGMLVPSFDYYEDFRKKLLKSGFKVLEEQDVSLLIIPTLKKFESQAKLYFTIPPLLLKMINRFLSPVFTNNIISGYLLATLEKLQISKYMILIVGRS